MAVTIPISYLIHSSLSFPPSPVLPASKNPVSTLAQRISILILKQPNRTSSGLSFFLFGIVQNVIILFDNRGYEHEDMKGLKNI